jgi:hypothetical protein
LITDHRNRDGSKTADRFSRSGMTQVVCRMCCVLAALFAVSSPKVTAQAPVGSTATQESYDTLLDEAVSAFDASDFARARALFERAYELRPNSRVLRGMGIAALRLERFSEAYRTLTASLKHPVQPLTASQREEVTELLTWMETSLGRIKLRWTPMEPAQFDLTVDGKPLKESAIWLPAGTHRVTVRARGFGSVDRTITLAPEQHEEIELTLKPEPTEVAAKPKRKPALAPVDAAHTLPAPERTAAPSTRYDGSDTNPSDGGSVLTRWWFWTAVAAVAAGGVATAVLLSQPAPISPVDTSEGGRQVVLAREGLR